MCCNLEVDINGEHNFFVDKSGVFVGYYAQCYFALVLSFVLTHIRKVLNSLIFRQKIVSSDLRTLCFVQILLLNGGATSFELITSFCYNNGTIDISPSNIFLLHSGSTFMEITTLIMQTELYLESIHSYTWSEFIKGLKQCQILFPYMNNSTNFQDMLNSLLGNLTLPNYVSSSCPSSSNSSNFLFSSSDNSLQSSRSNGYLDYWNFDDLSFLNIGLFEILIRSMISLHFDHPRICSFIFHYQKSKFVQCSSHDEKCKVSETNINLLSLQNASAFSCRALLDAFGMSLSLHLSKCERSKLEHLLGSRLDEFMINDLLVRGKKCAFDVDLTLRLIKIFLLERRINGFFVHRVKKVAFMMDLFLFEVAPDLVLKPSKFLALAMALPNYSRESHDRLYHAIHLYLEVHPTLNEDLQTKIWSALDLTKLSMVTKRKHLARNTQVLPSINNKQFKTFKNDDFMVHKVSQRVINKVKHEEGGTKSIENKRKMMTKKSRTFESYNVKSLPLLCH